MSLFDVKHIKISGLTSCVPHTIALNKDLPLTDSEKQALIRSTGIEQRRLADTGICASDLCIKAAEKLINELNWKKEEIGVIVFVTQTPDYILPGSSMLIHSKLGLSNECVPFDLNQGCAGYVYGLSFISTFMSSSKIKKGLLLVGDTITHLIDKNNTSLLPLFSDAGSATALEWDEFAEPIVFNMGANGNDYQTIIVENGGMRKPVFEFNENLNINLSMNGHAVFNFGLKQIAHNIQELMKFVKKDIQEIDLFILHQANKLLNDAIRKKLNGNEEQFPLSLKNYGNTSCATIPVTISSECQNQLKSPDKNIILCGFGVGLSWGSAYIHTSKIVCPDVIILQ